MFSILSQKQGNRDSNIDKIIKSLVVKMSDISWDILDDVNLKVAWRLVSKDMSKVFYHSLMVTVLHIEEAKYYVMMVCFTKKNMGMLDKLAKVGPQYHLHGHVADLVKVSTEDGNQRYIFLKWYRFLSPNTIPGVPVFFPDSFSGLTFKIIISSPTPPNN